MILNVAGLRFSYGSRAVLRDVDLTVAPGEILAVLGPNGVGKSTLLRCINAIQRPSHGAVLVEGADVLRMAPNAVAQAIGYVPQRTEAPRLTVFDAVLLGRKPHVRWRPEARDLAVVEAALGHLRLEPLRLRHLDELSGGELQQVAIARALVQEPRLLLFDEPTSALDLRNQVEILRLIAHVARQHHMAVVMTLHDLNIALRFANQLVFLKHGRIVSAGGPTEVRAEMVREVYGLPVQVHHINGCPVVVPLNEEETPCPAPFHQN
ncbi:MAG: ABC transporter ATP-binding protein [Desulfovibrio sp.]